MKAVTLLKPSEATQHPTQQRDLAGSLPFLMDGFVSFFLIPHLENLLRDSGTFQSLILQDVLQFGDKSEWALTRLLRGLVGVTCFCPCTPLTLNQFWFQVKLLWLFVPTFPLKVCPLFKGTTWLLGGDKDKVLGLEITL